VQRPTQLACLFKLSVELGGTLQRRVEGHLACTPATMAAMSAARISASLSPLLASVFFCSRRSRCATCSLMATRCGAVLKGHMLGAEGRV
jgi:hypothetical protein